MPIRAPRVISALLATVKAAAPATVGVYDASPPSGDVLDSIHIGYNADPESGDQSAESELARMGLSQGLFDELVTVSCAISILNGDGDHAAARNRAYEVFDIAKDAIDTHLALSITEFSATASIPAARLFYVDQEAGVEAIITFDVRVSTL